MTLSSLILKIFVEPNGKCPTRGKPGDAGFDVFADLVSIGELGAINVKQGDQIKIPLGFRYSFFTKEDNEWTEDGQQLIYIPPEIASTDYWLEIKNRSGVGTKSGMVELAAVCDASYRGIPHYCAAKITPGEYAITHGMKIAQALIHPFVDPHKVDIVIVSSIEALGITDRGADGFGSSGR
jgi:dUTPase